MASSFSQFPIFSSLVPINKKTTHCFSNFSTITFKNSKISSSTQENSSNQIPEQEEDPIKLAFAKAKSYKKSLQSNKPTQNPVQESIFGKNDNTNGPISDDEEAKDADLNKDVPLAVKLAMAKAKEYKKNKGNVQKSVIDDKIEGLKSDEVIKDDGVEKEVSLSVKLALEKANEYKKNKGFVGSTEMLASGLKEGGNENKQLKKSSGKKKELTISNIDFVGLGFSDKKIGRDVPAGLVPILDPFPEGDLPEVEILVGDSNNFGKSSSTISNSSVVGDDVDLYKPKVSTWGVFPRPNDISKTYGGGRTLRPGEALETAEEKAAKQARTKKQLAAYKAKTGLNIDPKLKLECEKAYKEGDSLMDLGKLKEALPFYEQVMEKMPFKSELHGLAAVQWSICLDSLNRSKEARLMYEKLLSHPTRQVSKKARQFVFGFQAMEMLKVTNSTPRITGYQNYFNAFVQDKKNYSLQDNNEMDEDAGSQSIIAYVIFLLFPIVMVFLVAASRHR